MKNFSRSQELFSKAQRYLPGGVDSPVRAFKAVGGTPLFIVKGQGARIYDVDDNEYIDYVCSWGPLILGHAHPQIVEALREAATFGTSFGASSELEVKLAEMVCDAIPSIGMVRFVNSGTEATMSALRLARAYTRRDKIIKFAGCYHGHSDGLLVKGGSGLATLGIPASPGVPRGYTDNTLVATYNDVESVKKTFESYPEEIAAVIVEPVAANMGVVLPKPGFLDGLRQLCDKFGALLVFDEVITGFRLGYGGAQAYYNCTPDLTCLGKIIGGGLPVGAYGGRRDIMEMVAPLGPVYQAGTLSGNPLAMTAGIETLKALGNPQVYQEVESKARALENGITNVANKAGISVKVLRIASLLTVFFTADEVANFESASTADSTLFARFFNTLLQGGIYWPPSQFEAAFVSLAHSDDDIQSTIEVIEQSLKVL